MLTDKAETFARRQYPLDFEFLNEAGLPVMSADVAHTNHSMTIDLKNFSGQSLTFLKLPSQEPTAKNHHLALWFRPGVLSPNTIAKLTTTTPGWAISKAETKKNGSVVFYLLNRDELKLPTDDIEGITLNPMNGIATLLRETRIKLTYRQVAYTGDERTPLSGNRFTILHIIHPKPKLQKLRIGNWTIAPDPNSGNLLVTTEGEDENNIVQFDKNGGLVIGDWSIKTNDNLLFTSTDEQANNTVQFDKNGGLAIGDWTASVDNSGNLLFSTEGEQANNTVQFDKNGGLDIGDWSITTDGNDNLLFSCKGGGTVQFDKDGGVYDGPNALVHNNDKISIKGPFGGSTYYLGASPRWDQDPDTIPCQGSFYKGNQTITISKTQS